MVYLIFAAFLVGSVSGAANAVGNVDGTVDTTASLVTRLSFVVVIGLLIAGIAAALRWQRSASWYLASLGAWLSVVCFSLVCVSNDVTMAAVYSSVLWSLAGAYGYLATTSGRMSTQQLRNCLLFTTVALSVRMCILYVAAGGVGMGGGDMTTQQLSAVTGEVTTAIGYSILWSLPLLLWRGSRSSVVVAVGGLFLILLTMKRGIYLSILVGTLCAVVSMVITGKAKRRIRVPLLIIVGVLVAGIAAVVVNSEMFVRRFIESVAEGGFTSGRTDIWGTLFQYLSRESIAEFVVGSGMGEVSALTEVSIGARVGAHNDWLEVLVNFGLIGLCSLLSVHLSIIFGWLRSLRARSDVAIVFSVVVVMLFVAVSCSMVSNSIRAFILFVVVGHLMALSSTGVVSGSGVKRGWRLVKQ